MIQYVNTLSLRNMLIINCFFHIASFTHKVKQTYAKEAAYCLNVDLLLRYDRTMNLILWEILPSTARLFLYKICADIHCVGDDVGTAQKTKIKIFLPCFISQFPGSLSFLMISACFRLQCFSTTTGSKAGGCLKKQNKKGLRTSQCWDTAESQALSQAPATLGL